MICWGSSEATRHRGLLLVFAAVAMVLALAGVYGVTAQAARHWSRLVVRLVRLGPVAP